MTTKPTAADRSVDFDVARLDEYLKCWLGGAGPTRVERTEGYVLCGNEVAVVRRIMQYAAHALGERRGLKVVGGSSEGRSHIRATRVTWTARMRL